MQGAEGLHRLLLGGQQSEAALLEEVLKAAPTEACELFLQPRQRQLAPPRGQLLGAHTLLVEQLKNPLQLHVRGAQRPPRTALVAYQGRQCCLVWETVRDLIWPNLMGLETLCPRGRKQRAKRRRERIVGMRERRVEHLLPERWHRPR